MPWRSCAYWCGKVVVMLIFDRIIESSMVRAGSLPDEPGAYDFGGSAVSLKQAIRMYDGGNPIIAEIKLASPSAGIIRAFTELGMSEKPTVFHTVAELRSANMSGSRASIRLQNYGFANMFKKQRFLDGCKIFDFANMSGSRASIRLQNYGFANIKEIVSNLVDNGCAALSVLTEPHYFNGSNNNLIIAKNASKNLPVLRKDFIVSTSQLYESKAIGADAVLLIAAVIEGRIESFIEKCREIGIEPLVEVHDEKDVDAALATDAELIGINNRDLKTLKVDLETTIRLSGIIPSDRIIISESGIRTPEDIRMLKDHCDAFLVGTSIMEAPNPGEKLRELICA